MKKNYLFYTVSMLTFLACVVLVLNYIILLPSTFATKLFTAYDIRAISYNQNAKSHYLNIQRQKQLLDIINQSDKKHFIQEELISFRTMKEFPPLIVHRFDHTSKIHLIPVGEQEGKLVLHMSGLGLPCFLIEKEAGKLNTLLSSIS